jgi:hypothetical protein
LTPIRDSSGTAISRNWLRTLPSRAGADNYFDGKQGVEHGHEWLTRVFPCPIPALGKWGVMPDELPGGRNPGKRNDVGRHGAPA